MGSPPRRSPGRRAGTNPASPGLSLRARCTRAHTHGRNARSRPSRARPPLRAPAPRADPPRPRAPTARAPAQLTRGRQTPWLPARECSCGGAGLSRRHPPRAPLPHPAQGSGPTARELAAPSPALSEERSCGDERRLRGHGRARVALGRARGDQSPSGRLGREPSREAAAAAAGAAQPG